MAGLIIIPFGIATSVTGSFIGGTAAGMIFNKPIITALGYFGGGAIGLCFGIDLGLNGVTNGHYRHMLFSSDFFRLFSNKESKQQK